MNTTTLPHRHAPPTSLDVYVYMTNTRETKYNIRYKNTLLDTHKTKCNNRAPPPQHTHTRYSHTLKEKTLPTPLRRTHPHSHCRRCWRRPCAPGEAPLRPYGPLALPSGEECSWTAAAAAAHTDRQGRRRVCVCARVSVRGRVRVPAGGSVWAAHIYPKL